jgi:L-amino acid N-acyltransferase YncA
MQPIKIGEVTVRKAVSGDESEIANVHLNSWREAYRGLLPQQYLDQLPLSFRRRMKWWKKVIHDLSDHFLYVAEVESGIVGFAFFGPARDEERAGSIEVGAIYLLEAFKSKGVGYALLQSGFRSATTAGYKTAYCWVLESNPTIKFYERSGATFANKTKDDEIGGKKVQELAYQWNDLEKFK